MSMEKKLYRAEMQKKGVTLPNPQIPVPETANPVTHKEPGLGAKTLVHSFKAGKPRI